MLYYLVDALPALLGSMATLWAVCSPRHWFVRSSFLGALLLLFLLIPAYELLVAGCVQIAVITGGITWWRKRRNAVATSEPWRVSLRNLLLFIVLAAVAMAVLASFPESPWIYWLRWTWPGFVAGCVTLFGMWLVVGQTRRLVRWTSATAFVLVVPAVVSLGSALSWITEAWTFWPSDLFADLFSEDVLSWMRQLFSHYLPVFAIGMGLFSAWLALFVKTGWFDPFGDTQSDNIVRLKETMGYVRVAWIALTVVIAVLPVTLLVKLALPREQPVYIGLKPACFALLYEAADAIDNDALQLLKNYRSLSDNDLEKELAKHNVALEKMRKALSMSTTGPRTVKVDMNLPWAVVRFLNVHKHLAQNVQSIDSQVEIQLDLLKLNNFWYLDAGTLGSASLCKNDTSIVRELWTSRLELNDEQRGQIVNAIVALEIQRDCWPSIQHLQRNGEMNAGWQSHLQVILDDWLGNERYETVGVEYHTNRTKIRLMLLDLALLSFQESNDRLPDTLDKLVPDILKDLPTDPYVDGPLKYRRTDDGYTLYSVGPNTIDELGDGDDMTLEALMQPATP